MVREKPQLLKPFQLFTPQECDEIIAQAKDQLALGRTTGGYDTKVRSNRVAWIEFSDQGRFYDIMTDRGDVCVKWLQHPYQVSAYGPGEFYDWHEDLIPSSYRSSIRSLTLTCTLEPAPNAQFQTRTQEFNLNKGEAILFTATEQHRATAPKSGTRWALTVWGMKPNPDKITIEKDA